MVSTAGRDPRRTLARTAAAGCAGLALVAAGATASDAAAKPRTYEVDGYFVSDDQGVVHATGDFVGTYRLLEENFTQTWPYGDVTLKLVQGRDLMTGCVDRNGDGKCGKKDPAGTITMDYKRIGTYKTAGNVFIESACTHPVTHGTGRFTGGLLFMTDITQPSGEIVSDYRGTVSVSR